MCRIRLSGEQKKVYLTAFGRTVDLGEQYCSPKCLVINFSFSLCNIFL